MVDDGATWELELADKALRASDADAAASHLSAAIRTFTAAGDRLQVLESVPDAEPAIPPNHEEFGYMLAAMTPQRKSSTVHR